MIDNLLEKIRSVENFDSAIIKSVVLDSHTNVVTVEVITDKAFTESQKNGVYDVIRGAVPQYFDCKMQVRKLTPDGEMIRRKILECIRENFHTLAVTVDEGDIETSKCEDGYRFKISVLSGVNADEVCAAAVKYLKRNFCGEFYGECEFNDKKIEDIEIEEDRQNDEFEMPRRYFSISKFSPLLGNKRQKTAIYISDLNFSDSEVVVCGTIDGINERTYKNSKNQEKLYYNFLINDGTASMRVTYFPRMKDLDKARLLKVGQSIVCTGKSEMYNGYLRYTADFIDYGSVPENFVPEKRRSKPIPKYYSKVIPQKFTDIEQTDLFSGNEIPECLKGKTFVVFDLETTGLNTTPVGGNMDAIIEIGAYKIVDGVICESFATFINPQRKLSDEIVSLTGITEEMIKDAPTSDEVMPDFFKFCQGNILVGHNAANFDFRFVDYYCSKVGYVLERKVIDTIPLSQELLFLSNYKLNTIADHFRIKFNHHRAIDDAYVTAKIFLELIKIKKSLPKLQ